MNGTPDGRYSPEFVDGRERVVWIPGCSYCAIFSQAIDSTGPMHSNVEFTETDVYGR